MGRISKNFLLFIIIVLLLIIFTPIFGLIYMKFFGPVSSGFFWGPSHPEYIDGFFISYSFFIPLMLTIFGGKKKYLIMAILVAIELLFFFGSWEAFIIDAVAAIIGWLLGEGILFAYKKLAPAKPPVKIKSVKK